MRQISTLLTKLNGVCFFVQRSFLSLFDDIDPSVAGPVTTGSLSEFKSS